jgi:hypothetical protein
MDVLLPFILPAGLFLALELLWCRPSTSDPLQAAPISISAWDPLAMSFVRDRLDVLAVELELLDRDESIFARAFRYRVAKSAYEALLADASRLAEASRLAHSFMLVDGSAIEIEISESLGPLREVLEV